MVQPPAEIYPGVVIDPAIMAGTPVISGTRVPVEVIVGHLAAGDTEAAVMAEYDLTEEQVRTALGYATELVASERVYAINAS